MAVTIFIIVACLLPQVDHVLAAALVLVLFFDVCFSNRALMSSFHCLWHIIGRVLAWVTLLFAVGTGAIQPLQA
jgi:hypothetical protein